MSTENIDVNNVYSMHGFKKSVLRKLAHQLCRVSKCCGKTLYLHPINHLKINAWGCLKSLPFFFNYFQKSFCIDYKEGGGFLPDDTLSHVKKTNLLSRCNRCTTLSNLKRKKREMNNQIHLHFLLKQPLCESFFNTK